MFTLKMARLAPKINTVLAISKFSSHGINAGPQPLGIVKYVVRDINWQIQINGPLKLLVSSSSIAPLAFTTTRYSSNQELPAPSPPPPASSPPKRDAESGQSYDQRCVQQVAAPPETPQPPPPPRPSSSQPSQSEKQIPTPNLPDREQLEKFFFRTIAFIWDVTYVLYVNGRKLFENYVVENPTVQKYWKEFLARMEKAKKD